MVGGPMRFSAATPAERGIRAAMTSRLGAGPAQFRREHGTGRFVDTVYLGAYRLDTVRRLGGYDQLFGGNEDAELAFRAQAAGGVYLDPAIISTYAVREGFRPLWAQFRRYGTARAITIRKHPRSAVSYTHLDVYKRQMQAWPSPAATSLCSARLSSVRYTILGAIPRRIHASSSSACTCHLRFQATTSRP